MKKIQISACIIVVILHSVACSDWFTFINRSPYTFHVSHVSEENDDFDSIPILRPLTIQSVGLQRNATNNDLQLEYDSGGRLKLHLSKESGRIKLSDIEHDPRIYYDYDSDHEILTVHATEPKVEKFSFIVSSDPQPYRLAYGTDLNAQRLLWLKDTVPGFHRIAQEESDVHLMIVNGDLTEYGRSSQWNMLQLAMSGIPIPMAYGLGNHDYENNIENCIDLDPHDVLVYDCEDLSPMNTHNQSTCSDWLGHFPSRWKDCCRPNIETLMDQVRETAEVYFSRQHGKRLRNVCARRMIERMRTHLTQLQKVLWDFSVDEKSLAYAWNYGSLLRFVQLHNRPNYTVELKGLDNELSIVIEPSYDWFINDMKKYQNRSYIVNVHNVIESTDLEVLRPYFGRFKAIFTGHTHQAGVDCFNGVPVFNSGALFKNEFLRVDFTKDGQCLDVLHFLENEYVSPMAINYCFQSVLDNLCE